MLSDGRSTSFNGVSRPTRSRRLFFLRGSFVFYPLPKSLGCASYVAKIILARKFINNRTLLIDRNAILLNGWKGSLGTVNSTRIDRKEKFCDGLFNVTFKYQGSVTNPW